MRIVTLLENTVEQKDLQNKRGLCLYIETGQHKILFDLGPDDTFLKNAKQCDVDVKAVDTVVISHGHSDHGGGLGAFLQMNRTAQIYVRPDAFVPHYNKVMRMPLFCGLDPKYKKSSQVVFTTQHYVIDKELTLFSNVEGNKLVPTINSTLLMQQGKQRVPDDFGHEQSLLIQENGKIVLIGGCAHRGIINIMKQATFVSGKHLDVVVSGFHLSDWATHKLESADFLDKLAYNLQKYSCAYFTCHCTGQSGYVYLAHKMGDQLHALSTGSILEL